jgi:hypothetical protein
MLASPFTGDEAMLMQYAFLRHNSARVAAWLGDGDPAKEEWRLCWQLLSPLLSSPETTLAAIRVVGPSVHTLLSAYNLDRLTDRSDGRVALRARHAHGVRCVHSCHMFLRAHAFISQH